MQYPRGFVVEGTGNISYAKFKLYKGLKFKIQKDVNYFIYLLKKLIRCLLFANSENTKEMVSSSDCSQRTWTQVKYSSQGCTRHSFLLVARREDFCLLCMWYQRKQSWKLVPGVDKPAGSENTRERQDIPKREHILGLGKVRLAPIEPYGKR